MNLTQRVPLTLGLLVGVLACAAASATAQTNLKAVYLYNTSYEVVTVKVIGPTTRTLKLGLISKQMILLAPGAYRCLYGFYGESSRPETFLKTRDFSVPFSLIPRKPLTISVSKTENPKPDEASIDPNKPSSINSVLPSSAQEFNEGDHGVTPTAQLVPMGEAPFDSRDALRFSEINIVATIGELYYPETDAQKRRARAAATRYLSQMVSGFLIPRLARQGFRAKYLGVFEELPPPEQPTLTIAYEETEGSAYSMFGVGEPEAHGVTITCSLSLDHPALGETPIWSEELTGENPEEIKVNLLASNYEAILYQNALRNLRGEFSKLNIDVGDWALRSRAVGRAAATSPARRTRRRTPRSK
jgi:hypothetical protein